MVYAWIVPWLTGTENLHVSYPWGGRKIAAARSLNHADVVAQRLEQVTVCSKGFAMIGSLYCSGLENHTSDAKIDIRLGYQHKSADCTRPFYSAPLT